MVSPLYGLRMVEVWFDDEADAEAFAEERDAQVRRVLFAGEDDLEDAVWLVEVAEADAEVVAAHGGWLIEPARLPSPQARPESLPTGPRRIKRQ